MKEIIKKQYYVIYKSTDVGYYETQRQIVGIVTDKEIAKDFCEKFSNTYYETLTVGEPDIPSALKNIK